MASVIVVAFIRGCWGFYATILTRYVEPDDMPPPVTYYPDGERTF